MLKKRAIGSKTRLSIKLSVYIASICAAGYIYYSNFRNDVINNREYKIKNLESITNSYLYPTNYLRIE